MAREPQDVEEPLVKEGLHPVQLRTAAGAPVRVLRSAEQIAERVRELGLEVSRDYDGLRPVLAGVLKGACVFQADLARAVACEVDLDHVSLESYGDSLSSNGLVRLRSDLADEIEGRHVLVCEGVVDSGRSLAFLLGLLRARRPASLKVATLLDKRPCRRVEVPLEYVGWTVGTDFLVGYGLDAAERYRNLPYVGILEET